MYIGIDLGTSSVKIILVNENGTVVKEDSITYPLYFPQDGWAEQNPQDWLDAIVKILSSWSKDYKNMIKGISICGQMHGLVILDENDKVIRPAILWNDGRCQKQTIFLNNVIGKKKLNDLTGNIAYAGFTAPKVLWIKENEPQNFKKIKKIMLPKDYIIYMLTGSHSCDYSDASGTLFFDVANKCWSKQMCDICGIKEEWLPKLYDSFEVVGRLKDEYNLNNAIMTAGAGDNAAAAIGTATIKEGNCNISLGTSGTIFICKKEFVKLENNDLHSFADATGKYHLMGCVLSAARCNEWWIKEVLESNYLTLNESTKNLLGNNSVYFLPYLMGERSPHNDTDAKGAFIGLRGNTKKDQMSLAVLEGVAFALRDCIEVARNNKTIITSLNICGGGAKSEIWKHVIANVLNVKVYSTNIASSTAYGASILAMLGAKLYKNIDEACDKLIQIGDIIEPNQELVEKYNKKYNTFKKLYPTLKEVFKDM